MGSVAAACSSQLSPLSLHVVQTTLAKRALHQHFINSTSSSHTRDIHEFYWSWSYNLSNYQETVKVVELFFFFISD